LALWSGFDIAVFEFAGFSDMVKLAIYPALGSCLLFGMAIGFAQLFARDRATQNQDPETLAKDRKRGERRYRILMVICAFLLLACITVVPEPWQWFLVAILATLIGMPLAEMFLIPWVPDRRVRDVLAMAIRFIPAL
jgi:hypothetical protein